MKGERQTQSRFKASEANSPERLKLITQGRITGLPHVVELRYAKLNDSFYVLAGKAGSDWILNALQSKSAKLILNGFQYQVAAKKSSQDERDRSYQTFVAKYGSRIVKEWYSPTAACLKLIPQGAVLRHAAVKGEGDAKMDYETWKLTNRDYYRGVADAFDSASEEYDFTISHNFINTWIRRRSINALLRLAKSEDVLVEIGCGTGTEAILIAPHVSRIIATDISEKMLQILRLKLRAKGLGARVLPVKAGASEVSILSRLIGGGQIDLAYSFNGALNCEPQLKRFVTDLSALLKKGAYFVCSIRNTFCLSEALSHALVFQFRKMTPRKKQPIMVSVGGMDIPSIYYSPRNFAEFFTPYFRLEKQIALPGILPPAYLNDYYLKLRDKLATLERLEPLFSERFPLNSLGDQTLFVFRRK